MTDWQSNNASANLQIVINAANHQQLAIERSLRLHLSGYTNGEPVFMAGSFIADGNGNLLQPE